MMSDLALTCTPLNAPPLQLTNLGNPQQSRKMHRATSPNYPSYQFLISRCGHRANQVLSVPQLLSICLAELYVQPRKEYLEVSHIQRSYTLGQGTELALSASSW